MAKVRARATNLIAAKSHGLVQIPDNAVHLQNPLHDADFRRKLKEEFIFMIFESPNWDFLQLAESEWSQALLLHCGFVPRRMVYEKDCFYRSPANPWNMLERDEYSITRLLARVAFHAIKAFAKANTTVVADFTTGVQTEKPPFDAYYNLCECPILIAGTPVVDSVMKNGTTNWGSVFKGVFYESE